jgi:hypothetical protein
LREFEIISGRTPRARVNYTATSIGQTDPLLLVRFGEHWLLEDDGWRWDDC